MSQAMHALMRAFAGTYMGESHQIHWKFQGQLLLSNEAEVQQRLRLGIIRRTAKFEY